MASRSLGLALSPAAFSGEPSWSATRSVAGADGPARRLCDPAAMPHRRHGCVAAGTLRRRADTTGELFATDARIVGNGKGAASGCGAVVRAEHSRHASNCGTTLPAPLLRCKR
jgi:hypothetical protein